MICYGETKKADEEGAFNKASVSKRIAIVLAGGLVNIVFGIIVYFLLIFFQGSYVSPTVEYVLPEYSEYKIELKANDVIKEIDGKVIRLKKDIDDIVRNSNGKTLKIKVERDNNLIDVISTPIETEYGYMLGIKAKIAENTLKNSIYYAFWNTTDFTFLVLDGIKLLFTGNVGIDQMSGPIGISNVVVKTDGIYDFIYILSVISLSLGVTNLLPIPALDGGKIVILLIEAIRKKPLKEELELEIQSLGFTFLILLSIIVSYNDVLRIL